MTTITEAAARRAIKLFDSEIFALKNHVLTALETDKPERAKRLAAKIRTLQEDRRELTKAANINHDTMPNDEIVVGLQIILADPNLAGTSRNAVRAAIERIEAL